MATLMTRACAAAAAGVVAAAVGAGPAALPAGASPAFLGGLGPPHEVTSTVPSNGDVNPYGVAVVSHSTGDLVRGDVLVSNFNNSGNSQGTGTTIVQVDPSTGATTVFAQLDPSTLPGACPGGVGLTTALAILPHGWVVVGSLPASVAPGCLIVINRFGQPVETISGGPINGPWDMAAVSDDDGATLLVTNVLNGLDGVNNHQTGTLVRVRLSLPEGRNPVVKEVRTVATGIPNRLDANALVVGPTGVGIEGDTAYVADSADNAIVAVPDALQRMHPTSGTTLVSGGTLNDPLGLLVAPNGDIVTVNGSDGNAVETTPKGVEVDTVTLNTQQAPGSNAGAGNLFGIALAPHGGLYFVDDFDNTFWLAPGGGI